MFRLAWKPGKARGFRRLQFLTRTTYIPLVRACPDYGDKRLRNKRTGPGGGTRRLHLRSPDDDFGLLWRGRNRIDGRVKAVLSLGMVSAVIGLLVQVPTIMKWP